MAAPKSSYRALLLGLLLLAAPPCFALESILHEIEVRTLSSASAPRFMDSKVLLTYRSAVPVRLVGARFEHESYRVFHTYSRNENEVFLLLLGVPRGLEELRYRITVDGVWMNDPFNPRSETDAFGTTFSVFSLTERPTPGLRSPQLEADGSVTFVLRSQTGRRVYLVGDFNKWDPFWDHMPEVSPGLYQLNLRLPPGRRHYRFSVNGERLPDPLNPQNTWDSEGNPLSVLDLPAPSREDFSLYQTGGR